MPTETVTGPAVPRPLGSGLRVKLFLGVLALLALIYGPVGYLGYRSLVDQNESYAQEHLASLRGIFDALLDQSERELARHGVQIASSGSMTGMPRGTALRRLISPELLTNLSGLQYFDAKGELLQAADLGGAADESNAAMLRAAVARAIASHRTMGYVQCRRECVQHVLVPATDRDGAELVVGLARPIADVMLEFNRITGADVAMLSTAAAAAVPERLVLWGRTMVEVTNAAALLPKLRAVVGAGLPEAQADVPFRARAGSTRLLFVRTGLNHAPATPDVDALFLVDERENLVRIAAGVRGGLFAALAGLVVSATLLFAMLTPALRRLTHITTALPLLAEQKFQEARALINHPRPAGLWRDEIDLLNEAAVKLAQRLRALSDVEAASDARARFLAVMSHEIRTPMNGVLGMIELVDRTELNDHQRELLGVARESAKTLLRVIDDILDYSKVEAGRIELEEIPFSVAEMVEGAVETLAPAANNKNLKLCVYADPALPASVRGDSVRLRQVLFNLCSNAIKFTAHGHVLICVDVVARGERTVELKFRVVDTGIGIPALQQGHLFQPFRQAESSTTRRFGGTGLGLSIAKGLVELMGGKIGLSSEVGKGSEFWFSLSLPLADEAAAAPDRYATVLGGKRVGLLLVDPLERKLMARCLTGAGAVIAPTEEADIVVFEHRYDDHRQLSSRAELCLHRRPGHAGPEKTVILQYPIRRADLLRQMAVLAGSEPATAGDSARTAPAAVPAARAEPLRKDLRLLVAEDHPTNQMVIRRQLEVLGLSADIAADGQEAQTMLATGAYALLITDIHMPNVDGYELVRSIRRREAASHAGRLPIIAMTANALQGEADRCLAVGMDGYISKPVTLEALEQVLRRWLPGGAATAVSPPAPAPQSAPHPAPPEAEAQVLDLATLREMVGGDDALIKQLLQDFVRVNDGGFEDLRQAVTRGDGGAVRASAHKLLGSARTLSAKPLARSLEVLQEAGADNQQQQFAALYQTARREYDRVCDYIRSRR